MRYQITRRVFLSQFVATAAVLRSRAARAAAAGLDPHRMVLLADTHLTRKPEIHWQREWLARYVREILALSPRPANVIVLGDLSHSVGFVEDYALLKELMEPFDQAGIRWYPMMGNHDRRDAFYASFPEYRDNTPVPDRVVSIVETPRADFILLDSCLSPSDTVGKPGPVPGGLDESQDEWLRKLVSQYRKPVFVGAHHPLHETLVGPLLVSNPAVAGYIHGHHHRWMDNQYPGLPLLGVPSTGHWGDIGYTILDLKEREACFTLVQNDYFRPRPLPQGEENAQWKARVAENQGKKKAVALTIEDHGFVPMFNGRDLAGWVPCNIAPESFSVRDDGLIMTTGQPIGTIRTERMYENFVIDFEWRHLTSGGNSGLFVWADGLPVAGSAFSRGIEVQILDSGYDAKGRNEWFTTHGDLFPVNGAELTLAGRVSSNKRRSFPMEERTRPSPEWNHYRVVGINGSLSLSVNGKEVTIARDASPRKGYLMLESEGGECHFRNVRIRELPGGKLEPGHVAEEADGFAPIFTGLDLRGWRSDAAGWSVEKDQLCAPEGSGILWSAKAYGNFEVVGDVKVRKVLAEQPQGIMLRSADGEIVPLPKSTLEGGKWARLRGVVKTGDSAFGRGPWHIGLTSAGGRVAWRNLFLREKS